MRIVSSFIQKINKLMLERLLPDNEYSDRVIWDSFKNGDKEAFAILYYQNFRILIQKCFRYSNDINLIEDCIQDLFLEIWNNKMNLTTPKSVKAYLVCSIQRKLVRQIKKSRSWQNKDIHSFRCEVSHSIEDEIILQQNILENKKEICRALDTLTKRQKEAVYFRYYQNLSYSEISSKMEISTDSVYNLVSKALDSIQKSVQRKPKFQTAA